MSYILIYVIYLPWLSSITSFYDRKTLLRNDRTDHDWSQFSAWRRNKHWENTNKQTKPRKWLSFTLLIPKRNCFLFKVLLLSLGVSRDLVFIYFPRLHGQNSINLNRLFHQYISLVELKTNISLITTLNYSTDFSKLNRETYKDINTNKTPFAKSIKNISYVILFHICTCLYIILTH